MIEPFGAWPPSAAQEKFRALAHGLPRNQFGRKAASLLLGPAGGRRRRAYDVTVFGTQRARLHPYDNLSEKRVYLTPQFWEAKERAALAAAIVRRPRQFLFVDVGANAGLYALYARSVALRADISFRALCVEADPVMQERLAFNIEASNAAAEILLARAAAAGQPGPVSFSAGGTNRGEGKLDPSGAEIIAGRTLASLLADAKFDRVDALKIDIEGAEFEVLSAFLGDASAALAPRVIIVETAHQTGERRIENLLTANGYRVCFRTGRNLVAALNNDP